MSNGYLRPEDVSTRCVIVYDSEQTTAADAMLVDALRCRGFDVHIVVASWRRPRRRAWSVKARLWMERLISRRGMDHVVLSPIERVGSAEQLLAHVASLQPGAVFHFATPGLASAIAGCGPFPVYQVSLNGLPQDLRMEAAAEPSADAIHTVAVTGLRGEWPRPRVLQRSETVPLRSWAVLDQTSAARRAVALLLRAIDSRDEETEQPAAPPVARHRALRAMAVSIGSKLIERSLRRWRRTDAWFLAYRRTREDEFRVLSGGRERFFADPRAVRHGDDDFVFCEEYHYCRGRGRIAVSRLQADGTLSLPTPVLERPYHLSYPFVFADRGEWWMVPETSDNRTVDLYRAIDFPQRWTLEATLLRDIFATDATLFHDGQKWFMFVSLGEFESSAWDELSIFVADELTGPWRPHRNNPVKRNPLSSRPAGGLFWRGGQLVRPAQVCSPRYGTAVRFCIVDELSEERFVEHEAELIAPSCIPGAVGLHTWSETENLQVVDARLERAWLDPARFERQIEAARRRRGQAGS